MKKNIKIRSADKWFSLCIRQRANWKCQRCGKYYPDGKRMALHCSHFHGRAKYGTRFDPLNCEALCYGCHMYLTAHPHIHNAEKIQRIGGGNFDRLLIRANSTNLGRLAKRSERDISKHYKKQYEKMVETGSNEFEEFKLT